MAQVQAVVELEYRPSQASGTLANGKIAHKRLLRLSVLSSLWCCTTLVGFADAVREQRRGFSRRLDAFAKEYKVGGGGYALTGEFHSPPRPVDVLLKKGRLTTSPLFRFQQQQQQHTEVWDSLCSW